LDAYASFNGSSCKDFECHFTVWGIVVGIVGGPISILLFLGIHILFCNQERSRGKQAIVGIISGASVWVVASFAAAVLATWGKSTVGHNASYPVIGYLFVYVSYLIMSVLYVRSKPRAVH